MKFTIVIETTDAQEACLRVEHQKQTQTQLDPPLFEDWYVSQVQSREASIQAQYAQQQHFQKLDALGAMAPEDLDAAIEAATANKEARQAALNPVVKVTP